MKVKHSETKVSTSQNVSISDNAHTLFYISKFPKERYSSFLQTFNICFNVHPEVRRRGLNNTTLVTIIVKELQNNMKNKVFEGSVANTFLLALYFYMNLWNMDLFQNTSSKERSNRVVETILRVTINFHQK